MLEYLNFDLSIALADPASGIYRVTAEFTGSEATGSFQLPFGGGELSDLLTRLRYRGGVPRQFEKEVSAAKELGGGLYRSVFTGEVVQLFRQGRRAALGGERGLRVRLRLNSVPEIATLPWEYLYDAEFDEFIALSSDTPVVRYIDLDAPVRPLRVTAPLRVLVMIASPRDMAPLDTDGEWQKLRGALAERNSDGTVILERLDEATMPALQRRLRQEGARQRGYHVFHFIGHGGYDDQEDNGAIVLEGGDRGGRIIPAEDLGIVLHDHPSLRLAFLNTCEGARTSAVDLFAGTAQKLVQKLIPAVIAMQFQITDQAAAVLAREFYGAVAADGYPIDAALAEARKAIKVGGNTFEWGTPVLFMRSEDGRIFDVVPPMAREGGREQAGDMPQSELVAVPAESDAVPAESSAAPAAVAEPAGAAAAPDPAPADEAPEHLVPAEVQAPGAEQPEVQSFEDVVERRPPVTVTGPVRVAPMVMQLRYDPPPPTSKVSIEVSADTVVLRYGRRRYSSPLRLDQQDLVEAIYQSPSAYGEALFRAIIGDEVAPGAGEGNSTQRGYVTAMERSDRKLRVEVRVEPAMKLGDPMLQTYKWEYIKDPGADVALALFERVPFYRLQGSSPAATVPARPLKVLVAICSPVTLGRAEHPAVAELPPIGVELERRIVSAALDRLQDAGLAEYRVLDGEAGAPASLDNLREALEDGFHVVHVVAHGVVAPATNEFCLVMEKNDRQHHLVPAAWFRAPLLGHDLRLAVLMACQSAIQQGGRALQGLGPRLVELGLPAVIAMQDLVPIDVAQYFTQHFYDDLARSGRVDMAMAATRFALHQFTRPDAWDWGTPVLLMSNDDGRLFEVDEERAARLEELRPEIMTYGELPGGDPTARRLAHAIDSAARAYGADAGLLDALRVAAGVARPIRPDGRAIAAAEVEPEAPLQRREALTARLSAPLHIAAGELQEYVERSSGMRLPSRVYQQVASALNAGKHAILMGAPGTGKTTLAQLICLYATERGMANGMTPTTATADWTTFDTVGGYAPTPQQVLEFRAGVFLRAIRDASWLVIDEINRAEIDKAFGELFTALGGQEVVLPYSFRGQPVRILPPADRGPARWVPDGAGAGDYVIHPNWRILASMNVYDKAYLFGMSFAFMRRFAFVDVDMPEHDVYMSLIADWMVAAGLPGDDGILERMIERPGQLMKHRVLGPAIVHDMIRYAGDRYRHVAEGGGAPRPHRLHDLMCEAFLLYAVPQLDGLERDAMLELYRYIGELFDQASVRDDVLKRIRMLYHHVASDEWEHAGPERVE